MKDTDIFEKYPLVLVEFFATWCPHCRRMMPVVDELKQLLAGQCEIVQFDVDKYPDLAEQAGIEGTPTFIIYKDGNEVWRQSGEIDGNDLLARIQSFGN